MLVVDLGGVPGSMNKLVQVGPRAFLWKLLAFLGTAIAKPHVTNFTPQKSLLRKNEADRLSWTPAASMPAIALGFSILTVTCPMLKDVVTV